MKKISSENLNNIFKFLNEKDLVKLLSTSIKFRLLSMNRITHIHLQQLNNYPVKYNSFHNMNKNNKDNKENNFNIDFNLFKEPTQINYSNNNSFKSSSTYTSSNLNFHVIENTKNIDKGFFENINEISEPKYDLITCITCYEKFELNDNFFEHHEPFCKVKHNKEKHTIECNICFEKKLVNEENFVFLSCTCIIHLPCFKKYVISEVISMF